MNAKNVNHQSSVYSLCFSVHKEDVDIQRKNAGPVLVPQVIRDCRYGKSAHITAIVVKLSRHIPGLTIHIPGYLIIALLCAVIKLGLYRWHLVSGRPFSTLIIKPSSSPAPDRHLRIHLPDDDGERALVEDLRPATKTRGPLTISAMIVISRGTSGRELNFDEHVRTTLNVWHR